MLRIGDTATGAVLAGLGTAVIVRASAFPNMPGQRFGAALFPTVVGAGLVLCGLGLAVSGLGRARLASFAERPEWSRDRASLAGFGAVVGGVAFCAFAADTLGFLVALPLALLLWLRVLRVRWPQALLAALVASALLHVTFYSLLRVPLPWGALTSVAW